MIGACKVGTGHIGVYASLSLKDFLRKATGVGAINLIDRFVGVLLGVLLARWLGADEYGIYAFVMAVISLLLIPAKFGMPNLVMREIAAARSDPQTGVPVRWMKGPEKAAIISSVLVTVAATLVVFFTLEDENLGQALFVGLCLLPVLAVKDLRAYALRAVGWAITAQIVTVLLPSILALISVVAMAIYWPDKATYALGGRFGATAASLALTVFVLQRAFRNSANLARPEINSTRALLKAGFPFLLISGVAVIMARTDVVMLGILTAPREAGIYNAALQGALLVSLVINTSNTIVAPEFARLHAVGDKVALQKYAVSTARVVLFVAVPIIIVLVLFGQSLLIFLFGLEFGEGAKVLSILAIGYGVALVFGETGFMLNMTGHEATTFRLYAASAVLNVVLNIILIPFLGPAGAALATVATLNIQRILGFLIVRRRLGISTGCLII